eukprot:m.26620 g.26620  ORF g.26620 m.26620 type:complete len:284 (-) comp15476_c0_seq1:94-945(-)
MEALVVTTLALVVTLFIDTITTDFWADVDDDAGPWCEKDHASHFLREPANAMTDFCYLWVGLSVLIPSVRRLSARAKEKGINNRGFIKDHPEFSVVFGLCNVTHSFGSFANHACRCHTGHRLDVFGMYCAVLGVVWLYFGRLCYAVAGGSKAFAGARTYGYIAVYVLMCVAIYPWAGLRYSDPRCKPREDFTVTSMVIVAGMCAFGTQRVSNPNSSARWITTGVTMLVGGKIAQELDQRRIWCDPESPIQGHALWHAATAYAIYAAYGYYNTEIAQQNEKQSH